MTHRPTVEMILVSKYRCRDEEGGCGAAIGQRCKTLASHRPTQPHQDRWTQWHLAGSPGAWWNQRDTGTEADLLARIEDGLSMAASAVAELRAREGRA